MAGYLGHKPTFAKYAVDERTSVGGNTYTLSQAPGNKNNIMVSAGGLVQYPSAYSVTGTTLTLTGVPSGQKVIVRHMNDEILYPALDDNAVTTGKIAAGAVGNTDIADNAVTGGKLDISLVAGDTMYASGTDTLAKLAKGTASQVLTMNAGATAPEWAAAGGSSMPIGASAHIGGSHQSVATGTTTKLAFNTELYDPNSNFNTTTFAYTVPSGQAGKYLVTAFAGVQALGDGKRVSIQIYKNNAYMWTPYASASGAFSEYVTVTGILDLAAADYIDVRGWHNKGSNGLFSASTYDSVFSIQRIV